MVVHCVQVMKMVGHCTGDEDGWTLQVMKMVGHCTGDEDGWTLYR